jgi:branched-chain amino acid transport system substrate-binding protein
VFTVYGYSVSQSLVHVLLECGDDLTRRNVMARAADLRGVQLPMLLPGITLETSAEDYAPIERVQMMRFTGERWQLFGPVLKAGPSGL